VGRLEYRRPHVPDRRSDRVLHTPRYRFEVKTGTILAALNAAVY